MKFLLIYALLSTPLFADHHEEGGKMKFEKRKAKALERINQRISKINEHKNCIQAASDKNGLKACLEKFKEHRREMREKRKEKRAKRQKGE